MTDLRSGLDRRLERLGGRRAGDQALAAAVSARIYDGIRAKGYTITQVAVKAGIDYNTVVDAMRGDVDPKLSTLIALAYALEIPMTELVAPKAA